LRAVVLALVLVVALPAAAARLSHIVVDAASGDILLADNPDLQNYPASLTKMMTLYLTFEALETGRLRLTDRLSVSSHASVQAPSKLSLVPGNTITVDDAIRGIVVKSANDAAVVVAEHLGGTEPRFAERMTAKAHQLGMHNTQFRNASGLPNRGQITTARDMAILAVALRRDFPKYYRYFSEVEFNYRGATHINHNHMLTRYDGIDGVKTGFIRASGFNIAVSAVRNGRRLIGVVLGGMSSFARDQRMAELLDEGFALAARVPVGATARLKLASAAPLPPTPQPQAKPPQQAKAPSEKRPPGLKLGAMASVPPPDEDLAKVSVAPSASTKKGWAVQIGAYSRPGPAKLAVAKVQKRDAALKGRPIEIMRGEGDEDELYRARVVGLTQSAARQACDRLRKQKIECLVVPPEESAAATIR
jgi:D-alanyl-D-alanine carboxypeptidase